MKTKSTSLARKALASPTFVARQPRLATGRDAPDLPAPANSASLISTSRSSRGCRIGAFGNAAAAPAHSVPPMTGETA